MRLSATDGVAAGMLTEPPIVCGLNLISSEMRVFIKESIGSLHQSNVRSTSEFYKRR
jgi:hypothetical protein